VANGHFMGNVGVVHLEAGQTFENSVVPGELAFIDESCKRSRSESFGIRTNPEKRVLIHRRRGSQLSNAVPVCQHGVSVLHYGNGHARHLKRLQNICHVGVKISGWSSLRWKNL